MALMGGQLDDIVAGVEAGLSVSDIVAQFGDTPEMRAALEEILVDGSVLGLTAATAQLETVGVGVDWALVNEAARDWAHQYSFDLVRGLNDTNRRVLQKEVSRWAESGEPLAALNKRLEPYFGKERAKLLASTETTRAYAEGNMEAWKQSGVVEKKRWNTVNDDRVCPLCSPLHRQEAPLNEAFSDGTMNPPRHPRCILPGNEVVTLGPISSATKSYYSGLVVEITFGSGRIITITQNHPILTPAGWIAAGLLHEGDYAISTTDVEGIAATIDPDDNHVPTAIEEIFRSFSETPGMSAGAVPHTAEDFYGDGRFVDGDIDIVYADGLLLSNLKTKFTQLIGKFRFDWDNTRQNRLSTEGHSTLGIPANGMALTRSMGGGNLGFPLSRGHSGPLGRFRLGSGSGGDSSSKQPLPENHSTDPGLASQLIFGFASNITLDEIIKVGDLYSASHHNTSRFGGIDASLPEFLTKGLRVTSKLAGQFSGGNTGLITLNEIVKVRNFDFSSHVYDLQADLYELYICNGIIVKNCRCFLSPVVAKVEAAQ